MGRSAPVWSNRNSKQQHIHPMRGLRELLRQIWARNTASTPHRSLRSQEDDCGFRQKGLQSGV